MSWIFFIVLHLAVFTLVTYLNKTLLRKLDPLQVLFFQYIGSFFNVLAIGMIKNKGVFFEVSNAWLVFIGVLFAFGVFAMNKAIKINLSRTFMVNQLTGLVSIILSTIFLSEYLLFDPGTLKGILLIFSLPLSFMSVIFLKGFGKGRVSNSWVFWSIVFIIIIGGSMFLVKVFVADISPLEVLLFQYIGSFFTMSIVGIITKVRLRLGRKLVLKSILVGILMSTSLSFLYTSYSLAPLAYVQLAQRLGTTLIGVLLGLFVFKESRTLNRKSTLGMLLGFISLILILISSIV